MNPQLKSLALRIFGPIDFGINAILNALSPLIFLKFTDSVPLFGVPSVAIFLAPMVLFTLTFATFFGFRNGVIHRNLGLGAGPLPPETPWHRRAWLHGLMLVVIGQIVLWSLLWGLGSVSPGLMVPPWVLAVVDGLLAGILGYCAQVNGIYQAQRIPNPLASDR